MRKGNRHPKSKPKVIEDNEKMASKDKATILIPICALIVTIIFSLWTVLQNEGENERQNNSESAAKTFEAGSQATSAAQVQQQISIQEAQATQGQQQLSFQQTQIAMSENIATISVLNGIPDMILYPSPEPILEVQDIHYAHDNSGNGVIVGKGTMEVIVANNGGGKAGFADAEWKDDNKLTNDGVSKLFVLGPSINNLANPLPITIETSDKVTIEVEADLNATGVINPYTDKPITGDESDYQLGMYWSDSLETPKTHIELSFTNVKAPLVIPLKIQLDMPVKNLPPTIDSPLPMKNTTKVGGTCFASQYALWNIPFEIINVDNSAVAPIHDNGSRCYTLPVGNYEINWYSLGSTTQNEKTTFLVNPYESKTVKLQVSSQACFDIPKGGSYSLSVTNIKFSNMNISDQVHSGPVCYSLPTGSYEVSWYRTGFEKELQTKNFQIQFNTRTSINLTSFSSQPLPNVSSDGMMIIYLLTVIVFAAVLALFGKKREYEIKLYEIKLYKGDDLVDTLAFKLGFSGERAKVTFKEENITCLIILRQNKPELSFDITLNFKRHEAEFRSRRMNFSEVRLNERVVYTLNSSISIVDINGNNHAS